MHAGPNKKTLVDFWRLVWQERPQCIVMVTNVVEEGKTKCEQYWPSREEGSQTFGPFDVSLLNEVTLPDYTVRTLKVCVSLYLQSAKCHNISIWNCGFIPVHSFFHRLRVISPV